MFSTKNAPDRDILAKLDGELKSFIKNNQIVIDSRKATANTIFCAYPGLQVDGREFISKAIENGCTCIVYEDDGRSFHILNQYKNITFIPIKHLQMCVGYIANLKYDNPSHKLQTIAVTGTNGKTSISYWLNQAYALLGKKIGLIGTLGAGIYPQITYNNMTTPDPVSVQAIFSEFVQNHVDIVAMEASSHAITQGRINGVLYKSAIFTNLTQDHLDYHLTMENYYQAKKALFYWQGLEYAIINLDDFYGKRLHQELKSDLSEKLNIITYGLENGDLTATNIKIDIKGTRFSLNYNGGGVEVRTSVIGKFNVYNLLAVAAQLLIDGYSLAQISKVLAQVTPVKGRMDTIIEDNMPLVVVDFAHSPDSLENALQTLKGVEHSGKLYCVFGCGGNRDKLKRPIMGKIAAENSDYVVVTSDNPRNEDPNIIINEIITGISKNNYQAIENRYTAIEYAISEANAHDIILIAGKGHEDYQEINNVKNHFSDHEVAKELIHKLVNVE